MTFIFGCPICEAQLEADRNDSGRDIGCPLCGQRFPVPFYDARRGRVLFDPNRTPRPPEESMWFLHAYACDGRRAPRVVRADDGKLRILCVRCGLLNASKAEWCTHCRTPFALESGVKVHALTAAGMSTRAVWITVGVIAALLLLCGLAR